MRLDVGCRPHPLDDSTHGSPLVEVDAHGTRERASIFPRRGSTRNTGEVRALALLAVTLVGAAPTPQSVVRAWSRALNANDNEAAAALFAPGARVIQPGVDVRLTPKLALAFNASLPCAGRIIAMERQGNRVVATFLLGERPKHRCDGPGEKAAALFVVRNGRIVLWEQIPVPPAKPKKKPPA